MPTSMNEKSFEDLLVAHLVEQNGYEAGTSKDYAPEYGFDPTRLEAFLRSTQPDTVEKSRIFASDAGRRKFLERVNDELSKRGVVDVLRNGVKHLSNTFDLYAPLPSALSERGEALYRQNRFSVIRQLHYARANATLSLDVALFINGLPVITLELKNRYTNQETADAIAQYRSRDARELILAPKRCAVHFAADEESVYMCTKLCGRDSWFLPFNKGVDGGAGNPINPHGLKTAYLWEDVLRKESLSDILEHYAQVIVEKDDATSRKHCRIIWPRWHQLEVVRRLLRQTSQEAVGRRFLIQHSAGSGKSNSITWLAYQLVELIRDGRLLFDSILLVTDRVNLDKQLRNNLRAFTHSDHIVGAATTSGELRRHLENGKKIIITTIHKFSFILSDVGGELSDKCFAVIIDEAHSSQSGKMSANANRVLSGSPDTPDTSDGEDEINSLIERYMAGRRMASNANFYAFTATPKNKTLETFGEPFFRPDGETGHRPFHVYSMKQAIEEGFILDVLRSYTTYSSYYLIRKKVADDPEFERTQAIRKLRRFVESRPETVEQKARVMVEHFHQSVAHRIGGRARCMICTIGIERAIDYYHAINRLLGERESPYKAIVAFSGEFDYHGAKLDEARLNGFASAMIEKTFRQDPYRFLIVADKFQTGYDEPLLHTMYVDKPLHGLQTVQTLSRLNRTCSGKEDTFVLDFVNDYDEVEESFQPFYKSTILSRETDPNKLNDLLATIEGYQIYTPQEVEHFNTLFWGKGKAGRKALEPLLDTMAARFLALDDESRVECKSAIKSFIRSYEFLSTLLPEGSLEWEKKETVLALLIHKLPKLGMDDLTRGLLEAIDFDRYRLVKNEERNIRLQNADTEIEPVPTSTFVGIAEPDMQHLSEIERKFNEAFGSIDWRDEQLARKQTEHIIEQTVQSDTLRNAMLYGDADTANQECDETVRNLMVDMMDTNTELMSTYFKRGDFSELLNNMVREKAWEMINPQYDEVDLKQRLSEEFRKDFADFCDGVHFVEFGEVLSIFFSIVNAETIPDLQGLRTILRRTLNCLYRAQHRDEDFRTWYAELVSRFEAFLKKIYWLREGVKMPPCDNGREPALLDAVKHFPRVAELYTTRNPKYERFRGYYRNVYQWRNNENHAAAEIPAGLLPTALHAAVALYLYTSMISANELKDLT